ncbi:MAG: glycoside hydrolase family 3 C-terminal domain-containing protein, partial [Oscillospiraceae bacterium]
WTLMCSYNKINGVYSCENLKLLTEILRDEWGFKGLVMTDWGAINERVNGVVAGLDLEMPGSEGVNDAKIVKAVQDGTLTEKAVDICALRVVELLLKAEENRKTGYKYDIEEHHQLVKTVAAQSAVLLKNDENILPISPTQNILVIGEFAKTPRYQGAGSSKINPLKIDTALNSMRVISNSITYEDGYSLQNNANDKILREQACTTAKDKDVVVIFAGLPDAAESEGFDRTTLSLPESHNCLIEEVCKVNKNVVVVLLCGAPVVMPWKNDVKGILLTYLGGQAGGSACADLLYGRANPSGKLAETFPLCIQDTSAYLNFAKTAKTAEYRESIFVGYRWYDGAKREVAYPFGFGLSYTTFEYSDLKISSDTFDTQGIIKVEVTIKNTGNCFGGEVAQLYVQAPQDGVVYRAPRELKG